MFVNHPKIKIFKNPYVIPELIHYALRKKKEGNQSKNMAAIFYKNSLL